ncbi:MAG: hypothetical protein WA970_18140, partial [Gammaproteobacteria bacterium]
TAPNRVLDLAELNEFSLPLPRKWSPLCASRQAPPRFSCRTRSGSAEKRVVADKRHLLPLRPHGFLPVATGLVRVQQACGVLGRRLTPGEEPHG